MDSVDGEVLWGPEVDADDDGVVLEGVVILGQQCGELIEELSEGESDDELGWHHEAPGPAANSALISIRS